MGTEYWHGGPRCGAQNLVHSLFEDSSPLSEPHSVTPYGMGPLPNADGPEGWTAEQRASAFLGSYGVKYGRTCRRTEVGARHGFVKAVLQRSTCFLACLTCLSRLRQLRVRADVRGCGDISGTSAFCGRVSFCSGTCGTVPAFAYRSFERVARWRMVRTLQDVSLEDLVK